jgi:alpha-N-acetylgalactosaminidase
MVMLTNALDNGLARTPPMGWLAWERFRCVTDCKTYPDSCISEKLFTDMADQLVKLGLKDLGYKLVNIDDCYLAMKRDAQGKLAADPDRFPHGIKYLSDYMHQRGLLLGIYEDFGNETCGGYPGSYGYLETDANTFAEWGVDMLKLDGCNVDLDKMNSGYPQMGKYLNATGRPIIYSCSWPAYLNFAQKPVDYQYIGQNCNLWRLWGDIQDEWDSVYDIIQYWAQNQDKLVPAAKPGQWNDPDMLIIGDFSLSYEESKTQFAIWAVIAAPLFMSNDLRTLSQEALEIISNKEIIAVNQDPLGIQGKRVYFKNQLEVWARPLSGNAVAVVLFNGRTDGTPSTISTTLTAIGFKGTKANVRDLYAHKDLGVCDGTFSADVNIHGVVMLKFTPTN